MNVLRYGHPIFPRCPDKGELTVFILCWVVVVFCCCCFPCLQEEPKQPAKQSAAQPSVQAPKGPVQVRRDYNPKAAQQVAQGVTQDQFLISPITGEKIPAAKMQEHMRYGEMCAASNTVDVLSVKVKV